MEFVLSQKPHRNLLPLCLSLLLCLPACAQQPASTPHPPAAQDPYAGKKKVLAIADVHTGYQHDSVSHALATIERLGRESGLYITFIRTDTQLITKSKIYGTGKYAAPPEGQRGVNAKNLDYFDAIFFLGLGEEDLSDQQKKDLLSFVHDDGKGFVGGHSAIDAFYHWPEYGNMVGAYFDNHPWGVFDAPIVVEEPLFPGLAGLPHEFTMRDEIYVVTDSPYARDKVDVLARLDGSRLNLKIPASTEKTATSPLPGSRITEKAASSIAPSGTAMNPGTIQGCRSCTSKPSSGLWALPPIP